jgi:hypothetical protein
MRKPVNLRDVHKVTLDFIDKREQIAGKATTNVALEAIDDRLAKLAEKFAQIAAGNNKAPIEVTDVIEGIFEERSPNVSPDTTTTSS